MIRLQGQSLACIVSHRVDAWIPECECPGADMPLLGSGKRYVFVVSVYI